MFAKNKWNGELYEVLKENGKTVVLKKCSTGKMVEIERSEYVFSYTTKLMERKSSGKKR